MWVNVCPKTRGEETQALLDLVARQEVPDIYRHAFDRWQQLTADPCRFARWQGRLDGRLFLGTGGPHVMETNLTFNRSYGVPLIPGSSLKGLARSWARGCGEQEKNREVFEVMFGKPPRAGEDEDAGEAGYLIFHDAWWVPGSKDSPLVREVVTVHHPEYYSRKGRQPATDFDSPNPNAQPAAQGSFLFVVEGVGAWANYGLGILKDALTNGGIGGKVAAGYGYFTEDEGANRRLERQGEEARLAGLPRDERLEEEVKAFSATDIAEKFGKKWNPTAKQYGEDFPLLIELVQQLHGELIRSWAASSKDNEKKAYRKITGFGRDND